MNSSSRVFRSLFHPMCVILRRRSFGALLPFLLLTPQLLIALVLSAPAVLLPSPSYAQASCGTTEVCRAPKIGPWRYWVGYGVNKWFNSFGEAEDRIRETILAGNSQFCTVTVNSYQYDVYIGLAASYPLYKLGIEIQHSTEIKWDIVTPNTQSCQHTLNSYWGVLHSRDVSCDKGFALKGGSGGVPAYCGKPNSAEEPEKEKGTTGSQCPVGNPCDVSTGNKVEVESDYTGSGAFPIALRRTYNSIEANAGANPPPWRPFGKGWSATYLQRIDLSEWGGRSSARAYRPDGRVLTFNLAASEYISDADITERLTRQVDGSGNPTGWMLRTRDDATELYDVDGKLVSVTIASGLRHSLTYDANGRLETVADDFGHQLTFSYTNDSFRRVSTIADSAGGAYQFTYDSSENLETVTYPDLRQRRFHYNLASQLLGVTDESGVRFSTFTYNGVGVTSTEHAGGLQRYTISYSGLQRTVTDPLATVRTYNFATKVGVNRNTGITQPAASGSGTTSSSVVLDANGNATSRTDHNGLITTYQYDLSRILETSRTEAYGTPKARTITTAWHSTFRLPTQIDKPGKRTTFTHDTNGNVLTKTVLDTATSASRTWTYTYDSFGQVLTADGPRTDVSDVTTYTYYSCTTGFECGQVHTIENALGHVTSYASYNAHGQPLTITDPNGLVTTLTYDARQRLTSRTVGAEQTTFDYWPTGLLKKATLPDGSFLQYTYDAAHRLTRIDDSEGNHVVYTLDAMSNRTGEQSYDPSNALTQTRTRVFNTLNQLSKEIGAAGTANVTTAFTYDNNGNQTAIAAPLSRNTAQAYDELNRLKQVADPLSGITQYGYNALDQLISVTDPRSKVTSYTYNALGDLKQQVSPDTGTTTNTYDSGGNLATSTDARSKTGTYAYDALNRVIGLTYPDQTISYTYDGGTNQKGRLTQVSDASGSTSWSYDTHGRVLTRQQSMGITKSLGYAYDSNGRLQTLTLPSGNTITYGYADGKITSLNLNGSTTILSNILYQPFGPTRGWTWGNSTLAIREYDADGKVTDIDSAGLKTYSYDDAFRITGITDAVNSTLSQSYGYDLLDRLTSATGTSLNQGWTYDANGNRLTQTGSAASTYTVSSTSNRLSSVSGALSRTYGYDNSGNTTGDGTATFSYNDAGRMISAMKASVTTTYGLNALGQRVKKTTSGSSTYFLYDEAGHLAGEYDNSGNLIEETVWLGDTPVATLRPNGGGVSLYYVHTDHLNAPRRISRPSDNVVIWRWDGDPFGTTAANQDPDGDSNVFVYQLRFLGQYFDAETALHYNYFRDYDPPTGRYPQSDPIGLEGGLNTYAYVGSNPINFADPLGLEPGGPWHPPEGVSLSCKQSDSCPQIEAKMNQLLRMISSHTGWDHRLPKPRGGNRHADEIRDLWRAYGNCQEIHNRKCKANCPPPASDPMGNIGIVALWLGGLACIAFPEVCFPGLAVGGAVAGATQ